MKKIKRQQRNMLISVALIVLITTGITLIIWAVNITSSNIRDTTSSIKSRADTTKYQAITALSNKNMTRAKTLFQQARQDYKKIGDTDNVIDTEAQLYLIEHSGTLKKL